LARDVVDQGDDVADLLAVRDEAADRLVGAPLSSAAIACDG